MNYYSNFYFDDAWKLIELALEEDIGKGDITSDLLISKNSESKAELLVKEDGIIAGLEIFRLVFRIIDRKIKTRFSKRDGDKVKSGEVIGIISGKTKDLLAGERVGLNLIQRMSGIATFTDFLIKKLNNPDIRITDTRKTTPNLRIFEKLAVRIGGGENHRFGLYDMVLIKDNHIEANGGIRNTLLILKKKRKRITEKIEIEVKNLKELAVVISEGKGLIDRVMLDNFTLKNVKEAIKLNRGLYELEVSGGVNESNINLYSKIKGVDYISIGSLTHSVNSLDISLNFIT